jgi:phosphate transport system substrate-binding protein
MKNFVTTFVVMIAVLISSVLMLTGCSKSSASVDASKSAMQTVMIKGSDTMVHLVSSWAEAFMHTQPDIQVSVTGGGSGTGIAALLNKTTDIASASRNLKDKEKKQAAQNGVDPKEVVVARDGIAIVVNPANPVKELSMEQLYKIYTGKVTNWKELGGLNEPILIFSRESSSGTYVFFQEHVLKDEDYAQSARLMPSSSTIVEAVAEDKGAIGYVGLGYTDPGKIKVVPVKKDDKTAAVVPSEESVRAGTYAVARPLYLYIQENAPEAVKQLVSFCLSDKGQAIVREAGYVPVQ